MAADQGHAGAQVILGNMYSDGEGVPSRIRFSSVDLIYIQCNNFLTFLNKLGKLISIEGQYQIN